MYILDNHKVELFSSLEKSGIKNNELDISVKKGKPLSSNKGVSIYRQLFNPFIGSMTIKYLPNQEYYFKVESYLYGTENLSKYHEYIDMKSKVYYCPNYSSKKYEFTQLSDYSDKSINSLFKHTILRSVEQWAHNLTKERQAKQSLANRINPSILMGEKQKDHKIYFTKKEKDYLSKGLASLKQKIKKEYNLNQDELYFVHQKLDYLASKINEFNKFDYRSIFYGIMLNLVSSVLYNNSNTFIQHVENFFFKTPVDKS